MVLNLPELQDPETQAPSKCCVWPRHLVKKARESKVEECLIGNVDPKEFYEKRDQIGLGIVTLQKTKEYSKRKWTYARYKTKSNHLAAKENIKVLGRLTFRKKNFKFSKAQFWETKTKDKTPFIMYLDKCAGKWVYRISHKHSDSPVNPGVIKYL